MPRSRNGGGARRAPAPTRPSVPSTASRPAPMQQQARGASTAAPGMGGAQATGQQGRQPGLFGQMASTAAGVAVGSSIGHAIGGMFGGSSSVAEPQDNSFAAQHDTASQNTYGQARSCETDARSFTQCMNENNGNMQICNWYLEQLKACQSAASQY